MSDTTIEPSPEPIAGDDPATTGDSEPAGDSTSGRERKYRLALRAEQQRAAELEQRIETLQRAEVQRLAAGRLADPADALRDVQLADCLNEAGQPDPNLVGAQIDAVLQHHPNYAAPPEPSYPPAPTAGGKIGGYPPTSVLDTDNTAQPEPDADWTAVLRQAAGG